MVDAALGEVTAHFAADRLHSVYVYGSVPRGTAVPGRSDLDLLIALHAEPDGVDRDRAKAIEASLDRRFHQIDGAGILLFSTGTLLSELERHVLQTLIEDLGAWLAQEYIAVHGRKMARM